MTLEELALGLEGLREGYANPANWQDKLYICCGITTHRKTNKGYRGIYKLAGISKNETTTHHIVLAPYKSDTV